MVYKMGTQAIRDFDLWEKHAPGMPEGETVKIHYYPAAEKRGDGCAVIFAGGAYAFRTAFEDDGYARFLNDAGLDAFVVDYRVAPAKFPYPLLDARRAVRFVRANAEAFGLDPHKIAVMGSSAGGHLAALVSTYRPKIDGEGEDELDRVDPTPDLQILCYPVIDLCPPYTHGGSADNLLGEGHSEELAASLTPSRIADEKTPRAFIWHTSSDPSVNVMNSYGYAAKLRELNIPLEMHIYPLGGHGLGLADEGDRAIPHVADWSARLVEFLKLSEYLKKF